MRFWRRSRWRKRKRANDRAEAHPAPSIRWADAAASPESLLKASAAAREARLRRQSTGRVAASIKEGRPSKAIIQDLKRDKPTRRPSMSKAALKRDRRRNSAAKAVAPVMSSRLSTTAIRSKARNRSETGLKIGRIAIANAQGRPNAASKAKASGTQNGA